MLTFLPHFVSITVLQTLLCWHTTLEKYYSKLSIINENVDLCVELPVAKLGAGIQFMDAILYIVFVNKDIVSNTTYDKHLNWFITSTNRIILVIIWCQLRFSIIHFHSVWWKYICMTDPLVILSRYIYDDRLSEVKCFTTTGLFVQFFFPFGSL